MAKSVEQDEPQFDWVLFGMIVRKTRQRMGYKKAEVFCESVYRRARVNISPVTYYRIERAEQEPTAVQLFGICMALFGEPMPEKVFNACASEGWTSIEASHSYADAQLFTPGTYQLPHSWIEENTVKALEEEGLADSSLIEKHTNPYFPPSQGFYVLNDGRRIAYDSWGELAAVLKGEPRGDDVFNCCPF